LLVALKKVLIITYYWPPSGGAGVQRWLKFTKYLPEFGWEPIILTVQPEDASYPLLDTTLEDEVREGIRVIKTPSREIYKLYQKFTGAENIPSAGFANEKSNSFKHKIAKFIRGNFFIPDPRRGWNRYATREAMKILAEEKDIQCIITSSPPHSTQLIGLKLQKRFSIPWLADLRDPWTDIFYYEKLYTTLPAHWLNLMHEKRVLKNADRIIVVGPFLKKMIEKKYGVDRKKVQVVVNGFDEDDFSNIPDQEETDSSLTYVGTLSDQYPIDSLVETFYNLIGENPEMKFRFVGSVSSNSRKALSRIPEKNIEYIPHVSHVEAIRYMRQSGALLLIIPDHSSGEGILTGKLFEYLASGRPIVGIGPVDGDAASVIRECGAGEMVGYTDKVRLKAVLTEWIQGHHKGKPSKTPSGASAYSRRNMTARIVDLLNQLNQVV